MSEHEPTDIAPTTAPGRTAEFGTDWCAVCGQQIDTTDWRPATTGRDETGQWRRVTTEFHAPLTPLWETEPGTQL